MKVLHVVALVGPGNPYGGPTSVAYAQQTALTRRGHDVKILAGLAPGGPQEWPTKPAGVTAYRVRRVSRRLGYSGLVSPQLWKAVRRAVREADVAHVHMGRDPLTLVSALICLFERRLLVIQTHGMIETDKRLTAGIVDTLSTRLLLRRASVVACLHEGERDEVNRVARGALSTAILPNGVDTTAVNGSGCVDRGLPPTVLFVGRIARRKRPLLFAQMARAVCDRGVDARFELIGPDGGDGDELDRLIAGLSPQVRWVGPIEPEEVRPRLAAASVLVLPTVNERFGMVVIEALSVQCPVVVTDTCALAGFVRENQCGVVVESDDADELEEAVLSILADIDTGRAMGRRGRDAVRRMYSLDVLGESLDVIYVACQDRAKG